MQSFQAGSQVSRSVVRLVMMRILGIRVVGFLLIAVCGVVGQQRQENRSSNLLPDAPSAGLHPIYSDEAQSPLAVGALGLHDVWRLESEGNVSPSQTRFADFDKVEEPAKKESRALIERYLFQSLRKRNLNYHPSESGSLISRASYAASSVFVTKDDSGRLRPNTSYFVGVLSSAVIHTAYSPYWRRSVAEPFSNFGSDIGNDAGMNFLHEFGPGIEQLMKNHTPKLISRIEVHISRNQYSREVAPTAAR